MILALNGLSLYGSRATFLNHSYPSTNLSALVLLEFNLSGHEPSTVVLGKTKVPFLEYLSRVRSTELWLVSGTNWTQYSEIRQGQGMKIIAYTLSGGDGDLYLIDYANSSILHKGCHLQPGYSNVTLLADKIGRTLAVLMVENQPSNALVIDVLPPIVAANGPRDIEQFSPGYALVTITSDRVKGSMFTWMASSTAAILQTGSLMERPTSELEVTAFTL